jgi:hypothetical protein
MCLAGTAAFIGVAVIVLVSTFVSPIWTVLATALPFTLIVAVATMQGSGVPPGRVRGTMILTWISNLVTLLVLGTWLLFLFFGLRTKSGVKPVWQSFAIAIGVWAVIVLSLILLYIYWPRFNSLIDQGTIHGFSSSPAQPTGAKPKTEERRTGT